MVRMFFTVTLLTVASLLIVTGGPRAAGEAPDQEIGIDEKLGAMVPLELGFLDSSGDSIYLRDVVKRPTILTLVYYHCPTICKPLLSGVVEVVEKTDLLPGVDYDLLTISFDTTDTPQSAALIKANFTQPLQDKLGSGDWRFMVADSASVAGLTEAVGFRFKRQEKDFAHGTTLIVLSPDGKIVRYLYGLRFMPFDLKMAVAEADRGTIVPSVARVLQYCFSYDPEGRRYVFNVTRVAGAGIILFVIGWVAYVSTLGRGRKARTRDV